MLIVGGVLIVWFKCLGVDYIFVNFGMDLLLIIEGFVEVEVYNIDLL